MSPATRVKKRAEFERIQKEGARVSTRTFILILSARADSGPTRLGITASRKIGGAVLRNRAKRLVREAFRATSDLFPPGLDLVVIVRKPPGTLGLAEVVAEWRRAGSELGRRARALVEACQPLAEAKG